MKLRVPLGAALAAALLAPHAQAQSAVSFDVIETNDVSRLDAWTVAAIGRGSGALPSTLWQASDSAQLTVLFDRLPASFESPAAFQLARRALASSGSAPSGEAVADAARKRFSALGRMGLADDLSVMTAGAGGALNDPMIAQFAAQAELARGQLTEACRRAGDVEGEQPAFLLRLRAYCAAAREETAAADLALEIARAANADNAWFRSVINAMAARPARAPAARFDTSLNASVSLAAALRPAANPLNNASSLALLTVARAENAPAALRAQAAALAFRRGLLSPTDTRTIILSAPETENARLPPIAAPLRQAQAARGSLETATAIASQLRPNAAYVDFAAAARLFHDDIAALETAPNAAAALAFVRAAIASGDLRLAGRLLQSEGLAGAPASALAPLEAARAAGARQNEANAALIVQRRVENAATNAAGQRALSRDLAIFSALGYPLNETARARLAATPPQGGRAPEAGLLSSLQAATEANAIGEVAILSSVIAARGAHTLDADSLAAIIRALRTVGLEADARAFAVEGIIGGAPS